MTETRGTMIKISLYVTGREMKKIKGEGHFHSRLSFSELKSLNIIKLLCTRREKIKIIMHKKGKNYLPLGSFQKPNLASNLSSVISFSLEKSKYILF